MDEESDKLEPVRRIHQSRKEDQANNGCYYDAQQPRLGWGHQASASHRPSEHLQHK
jgi:hypothetical protein